MRLLRKRKCCSKLPENKELPLDLWREVLARLPVKTLLKLRCVCKSWCSIIDNPDFFSMHLRTYNNISNKTHVLAMEDIRKSVSWGCEFTIRPTDTFKKTAQILRISKFCKILGNCNGLVLFMSKEFPSSEDIMLRLWNPSIRKSLIIPYFPCNLKWDTYVLGFSPSRNDYRVVAFGMDRDGNLLQSYAVYSISTNNWIIKPFRPNSLPSFVTGESGDFPLYDSPHFSQGSAHWMVCGSVPNKYTHVLSFEFDTEDFHIVELPDADGEMFKGLTTLGELLAVFGISPSRCCIWAMKKEGGEKLWSLRFSGDSSLDSYNFITNDCYFLKRFYYDDTGKISLVTAEPGMKSYNISTQERQHLGKSISRGIRYMDAYVESLVWFP